ncbi:MAG: hypothetical protein KAV82_09600, partial [Phycisphaerae bacterium]|nr:hypothetical protein [Phycisphaerae bacterium]
MEPALQEGRSAHAVAGAITLAGVVLSIVLAFASDGGYQDDGLTHYLYARWAWSDTGYLVDTWGRPGLTCLLFPFARFGWAACRVESAVLSGVAVWFAYLTAGRLGLRRAVLIAPLSFCQPLFVMLAYDTMTETAVAFYLSLAVWFLVTRRLTASAVFVSACFVTRYEMLVLVPVWLIALRGAQARWYAYVALGWSLAAHNLVGVVLLGHWPMASLLNSPSISEYGSGTILTMFIKSLAGSGPVVGLLAVVGCLLPWRQRGAWVVPAVYAVHLLAQSVLYWRGAFASGGYPRFFVATAPIAALAALHAVNHLAALEPALRRRALLGLAGAVVVAWIGVEIEPGPADEAWVFLLAKLRPVVRAMCALVALAALAGLLLESKGTLVWRKRQRSLLAFMALAGAVALPACFVRPHRRSPDACDIAAAVQWLQAQNLTGEPLITTNIWASYCLGSSHNLTATPHVDVLADVIPGTVLLWDGDYSAGERFGITLDKLNANPAWRLRWTSPQRADGTIFARIYTHTGKRQEARGKRQRGNKATRQRG